MQGGDEGEHDASLDENEESGGYEEDNQGIQGKMFVNQHMIKICFKDEKQMSANEENKSAGKTGKS